MDSNKVEDRPGGLPQILFQVESGPSITVTFSHGDLNRILHAEETMSRRMEKAAAGQAIGQPSGSGQQSAVDEPRPVLALHQSDIDLVTLVKTYRDGLPETVRGRLVAAKDVNETHRMIGSAYLQQKREDLVPITTLQDIREKIFIVEKEMTDSLPELADPQAISAPNLETLSVRNKSLPGYCIFEEKQLTEVQTQMNRVVEVLKKVVQSREEAVTSLKHFAAESRKVADRYNTIYTIAEEVYGELIETVVALRSFILNRKEPRPTEEGDDKILSVMVDFLNKINGLGVGQVIQVLKDLEDSQEMDPKVTKGQGGNRSKPTKTPVTKKNKAGPTPNPNLEPTLSIRKLDLDIERIKIPDNVVQDIMSRSIKDESPVKRSSPRIAELKVESPKRQDDEDNGLDYSDSEDDDEGPVPKKTPSKKGPSPRFPKGKEPKKGQKGKTINLVESEKKRRVRNRKMDHFYPITESNGYQLIKKINTYAAWLIKAAKTEFLSRQADQEYEEALTQATANINVNDKKAMKKAEDSVAHLAEKKSSVRLAYTTLVRHLHYRWAVFSYFQPSFAIKYLRLKPPYPIADHINQLDEREKDGQLPRAKGNQVKTATNKIESLLAKGVVQLVPFPTMEELEALRNGDFEGPVEMVHSEDEQGLSDEQSDESEEEQIESPPSGKGGKRKPQKKDAPSAKKNKRYESSDDDD